MRARTLVSLVLWSALVAAFGALAPTSCTTSYAGFCAKSCSKDADCCPAGVTGCPGAYPENFVCDGGLCKAPACTKDADCAISGAPGSFVCGGVDGFVGCLESCETDSDCTFPHATCTGHSDEGVRICVIAPCVHDADCIAGFHCLEDGRCGCINDGECGGGKNHCVNGTCGCQGDEDCTPGLDKCTHDPAFRYPPSAAPGKP